MKKTLTEDDIKNIAAQLRKPEGELGVKVSEAMNTNNLPMTLKSIQSLGILDHDKILEIGHGNCGHLSEILKSANNVRYYGLDISKLMKQEAEKRNHKAVLEEMATYQLYDGTQIPYQDQAFDKIMTVNTIYFWKNPVELMKEIYRVLNKNGHFSICFAQKEYMSELPFTQYGFQLYDSRMIEEIAHEAKFKLACVSDHTDQVESKTGEEVERKFTVMVFAK